MIIGQYEKFCKDFHLCDGYTKAINSKEDYFLHHIKGENTPREELIENNLYYDCSPSCLRWVTLAEHNKIHFKGIPLSDEHCRKLSEAKKGKVISAETRRKMSEAKKLTSFRKGMSWKLVNSKRIWYKKEYSS